MFNQIAIMNQDGQDKKMVTQYGTDAWYPAPSPDHKKIAIAAPIHAFFMGGAVIHILDLDTRSITEEIDLAKL